MLNLLRSVWLLLFVIVLPLFSCNSGSGGGASLQVTVQGSSGNMQNVTVVLGDRNSAMITSGTTDANGQITFTNAPANATVTAATSCLNSGSTTTSYFLDVKYDVNEPVVMQLFGCFNSSSNSPNVQPSTTVGTMTINVTNSLSGVTQNEIITTHTLISGLPQLITQQTVTITQFDLQDDGKLSLFVIGRDAGGSAIGYGAAFDQTFADGMTVNITVDQPMSFVQYQVSNIPPTANFLCSGITIWRTGKGPVSLSDCHSVSSAPSSTTLSMPYMPGVGDRYSYDIDVFVDFSNQFLSLSGPSASVPSNQSFDLNQALSAPTLTVNASNTATPTFSWSGVDPAATDLDVFGLVRLASEPNFSFIPGQVSLTRASITYPELPDSLAALRPVGVAAFSVSTSAFTPEMGRISGCTYFSSPGSAPPFDQRAAHMSRLSQTRAGVR